VLRKCLEWGGGRREVGTPARGGLASHALTPVSSPRLLSHVFSFGRRRTEPGGRETSRPNALTSPPHPPNPVGFTGEGAAGYSWRRLKPNCMG
jgi:hypothetical protein